MKKKCRVYGIGGDVPGYGYGGKIKKSGGEPGFSQTQDSQKDPIFAEKTNNFMNWLRNTNISAQVENQLKQDMQTIDTMYQIGGGVSYPGAGMGLMPEIDDSLMLLPEGLEDPVPVAQGLNQFIQPTESDYINAPMQEFEPGGPDDPFSKNKRQGDGRKFGVIDPRRHNEVQAGLAAAGILTSIGRMDEAEAERQRLERQFGDVFQFNDVSRADRGDYLANVPGIGTNFRPDQTTLMGYNTKVAQKGYEVDQEIELSEAEINNLIAQGYNLEYLD